MLLGNAEIGKGREMRKGKDKGRILNIKYSDGDRGWHYKGERKKGNMIILNFEC